MPLSKIHYIGFYRPEPKAICSMCYEKESGKLAVSRSNASIEIWNMNYAPFIECVIPDDPEGSVEEMCWCNGRLFSAGLHGTVSEYNLYTLYKKFSVPVTSGAAWCMDINKAKTHLAIGTEAGYINIFSITSDGILYEKLLDKQEGRILCIKYDGTGDILATGSVDAVRVWDVKTGHALRKMTTSRKVDEKETIVWSIALTDDLTIISGDSNGKLTFWDGNIGAQIESLQSHQADILSICLSEDQQNLYCAGVDPIIMNYEKVKVKENTYKWVKSIQRKIHDHDVRSLVLAEGKLCSAGIDAYLAVSSYPPKTLVKYPPLSHGQVVSIASEARYLLFQYAVHLELWRLGTAEVCESPGVLPIKTQPEKLLVLKTKAEESVVCSTISPNGEWILYSTNSLLRIYNFSISENQPELSRISGLPKECTPCIRMLFMSCNKRAVFALRSGPIIIVSLSSTEGQLTILQTIDVSDVLKNTIHILKISPCNTYLVAADSSSCIAIWKLNVNNQYKFNYSIPKYHCPPTSIAIQNSQNNLVIVYADHKIVEYSLEFKKFTNFSSNLNTKHPRQWLNRAWPVLNVSHDPRAKDIVLLHDDSAICILNKQKKLHNNNSKIARIDSSLSDSLEGSQTNCGEHTFTVIKKYKHLVHFGWCSGDELLAVEVSPISLIEKLPPCLPTKQFGTM